MKKFYLFCSAGMSTSLLASKMQKVADEHKIPVEVKAFAIGTMAEVIEKYNPDCILLGPQVRYLYNDTKNRYSSLNKPILVIDSEDYGLMDGEKVLKKAIVEYKRYMKENAK